MRLPREVDQPTYEIVGKVERYDQRDHPTARALVMPGTPEYEEYYSRHPEFKAADDENRRAGAIARRRSREKDPVNELLALSARYLRYVLGQESVCDGTFESRSEKLRLGDAVKKLEVDPTEVAARIKDYGRYLGAGRVRAARLRPEWVYSHFAYPYTPEPYGKVPVLDFPNIICMAVPQDLNMMKNGIGVGVETEVRWKYSYGSIVSVIIAQFIRYLGYRARALPPDNSPYLVVPAFVDAGIGEQGRCCFVVTKEFGNNFRPAAVATDLPLALDKPVDFGLQDFCQKCLLCAEYCPSGAITKGGREVVNGVRRWPLDGEKCRTFRDKIGTDCGICQAVCPWNHPRSRLHDTIRDLNESAPILRKLFITGEKLVYGRYKPAKPPAWMRRNVLRETREN